jgi:hypothetical protein
VRDLFNVANSTPLRVRDHPQRGSYVEGLTHSAVSSYADVCTVRPTTCLAAALAVSVVCYDHR